MDIGNLTVKEQLEKKMGAEKAGRVLQKLNDAHAAGGDERGAATDQHEPRRPERRP